jgi:hypothetical protein
VEDRKGGGGRDFGRLREARQGTNREQNQEPGQWRVVSQNAGDAPPQLITHSNSQQPREPKKRTTLLEIKFLEPLDLKSPGPTPLPPLLAALPARLTLVVL